MEYKLTFSVQHSKIDKDNRRRNYYLFFLNNVLILKQKAPFDENWENGWQYRTSISNVFLLNNYLYQTRKNSKLRTVKYPVSKQILKQFNIPLDTKIELTN